MNSSRRRGLLLLLAVLLLPGSALAQGEVCEAPPPAKGPVSLIILSSGSGVHELAKSVSRGSSIVAKDANTIIFADGRVITADVDAAGTHLNQLGWGGRSIRVVATLPARRARPRRARG